MALEYSSVHMKSDGKNEINICAVFATNADLFTIPREKGTKAIVAQGSDSRDGKVEDNNVEKEEPITVNRESVSREGEVEDDDVRDAIHDLVKNKLLYENTTILFQFY